MTPTFKTLTIAGLTALTLGASAVATASTGRLARLLSRRVPSRPRTRWRALGLGLAAGALATGAAYNYYHPYGYYHRPYGYGYYDRPYGY